MQRRNEIYHNDVKILGLNIENKLKQMNLWCSVGSTAARRRSRISGAICFSRHRHPGQTNSRVPGGFRPVPNLTDPASHRHFALHDSSDPGMR